MTDKEVIKCLKAHETKKVHKCADFLRAKGYFTTNELENALREYGVARSYFDQLYHIAWKYEWVKKYTMTFEQFLDDITLQVSGDIMFDRNRLSYKKQYRINGNCIDKYEQEYVWYVAFMKKYSLS